MTLNSLGGQSHPNYSQAKLFVEFAGKRYLTIKNNPGTATSGSATAIVENGAAVNITSFDNNVWHNITLTIPHSSTGPGVASGLLAFKHNTWITYDKNGIDDVYIEKACNIPPAVPTCEVVPEYRCAGTVDYQNFAMGSYDNPNTLEYDNLVSSFHSTAIRLPDGNFKIWGDNMSRTGGSQLSPIIINQAYSTILASNEQVLKVAIGSQSEGGINQALILTTNGLYAVGVQGTVVTSELTTSNTFQKLSGFVTGTATEQGLPIGVNPTDVKMLFATYGALIITTCTGEVYVLVCNDRTLAGTGLGTTATPSSAQKRTWQRVTTNEPDNPFLSNVIAARGADGVILALDASGNLWSWGKAILNPSSSTTSFTLNTDRAVKIARPKESGTIKMIGATYSYNGTGTSGRPTYYVLYTDGNLYTAGRNTYRELGAHLTSNEAYNWVQPRYTSTVGSEMNNIHWISPNEHSGQGAYHSPSINVLSKDSTLWNWGRENLWMLGRGSTENTAYLPGKPISLNESDKILAVETGGHTTMIMKVCQDNFGYTGHRVNGSMGNGSATDTEEAGFTYATAEVEICGVGDDQNLELADGHESICESIPFKLKTTPSGGTFSVLSGNAIYNPISKEFQITGPGDVHVQYDNIVACSIDLITAIFKQYDRGNLDPTLYPEASASSEATNRAWLGIEEPTTDCGTKIDDETDGFIILEAPGSGSQNSPWILNGGVSYNFQITVNGNGSSKPVYWAVWYDVNGDGSFTDSEDVFETGVTSHGSPISTSFNVLVPVTGVASGASNGAVRVIATASNTTFTKEMNGAVNVVNGEVEDYYIQYMPPLDLQISGSVFNDLNGLNNNLVDGLPYTDTLYVTLIDRVTGTVIANKLINTVNGSYSFGSSDGILPSSDYILVLNKELVEPGTMIDTPISTLPDIFVSTGEWDGISDPKNDGVVNGMISISVGTTSLTNLNFGINERPTAIAIDPASRVNPGGLISVDVTSGFSGTDLSGGIIESMTITGFPINATSLTVGTTVYYPNEQSIPSDCSTCSIFPSDGITIATSDLGIPEQTISIDPASNEETVVNIPFTVTDNASLISIPTILNVPFTSGLPVKLINFSGKQEGNGPILITWSTSEEINSEKFELQHSIDGKTWIPITIVQSQGETIEQSDYNYLHNNPYSTRNLYRLKMIDIDGTFEFSNIISVNIEAQDSLVVYPNPATTKLRIKYLISNIMNLKIYTIDGKLIFSPNVSSEIDVSNLKTGVYIISIIEKSGLTKNVKFVVEN